MLSPEELEKLPEIKLLNASLVGRDPLVPFETIESMTMNSTGTLHSKSGNPHPAVYKYVVEPGTSRLEISGAWLGAVEGNSNKAEYTVAALGYEENGVITFAHGGEGRIKVSDLSRLRSDFLAPADFTLDVDQSLFEKKGDKDLLLFVCCGTIGPAIIPPLVVTPCVRQLESGVYYFEETPIASAIYEGDKLSESSIKFASVVKQDPSMDNLVLVWNDSDFKVEPSDKDYQEFDVIAYKESQVILLLVWLLLLFLSLFSRELREHLETYKKEWALLINAKPVARYKLCVPVYPKIDNRFITNVWAKNIKSDVSCVEKNIDYHKGLYDNDNLKGYDSHHRYKNLMEGFSMDEVYPTIDSIYERSPEEAAAIIAKNLLRQPKGLRAVSIDNNGGLSILMGGPIILADRLEDVMTDEARKAEKRLIKDYLYSMVYFGEDVFVSEDTVDATGRFFYDAPIHFKAPKIKSMDDSVKQRYETSFEKLYCNDYVNEKDENGNYPLISGCEALRNLLTKVFTIVRDKYGISIDYALHDIEGMRNTAHDMKNRKRLELEDQYLSLDTGVYANEKYAAGDKYRVFFDSLWDIIANDKIKELDEKRVRPYNRLYEKLRTRGFFESEKTLNSIHLSQVNHFGYIFSSSYEARRNVNIWDQVALEYYAGVFDEYMFAPIRGNGNMIAVSHVLDEQKGYVYNSSSADFENYLGGSVKLPEGMTSNPSIYGGCSSRFVKKSMDNWKALPSDMSPFAHLVGAINNVRGAICSSAEKAPLPFVASVYWWTQTICHVNGFWNEEKVFDEAKYPTIKNIALRSFKYYRELLMHTWLCNPSMMYAYVNYDEQRRHDFQVFHLDKWTSVEFKLISREEYCQNAYGSIQDVADELNAIIGHRDIEPLPVEVSPENNPYLLTGVKVGGVKLYRLTLHDFYDCKISDGSDSQNEIKEYVDFASCEKPECKWREIEFAINGKHIKFTKAVTLNDQMRNILNGSSQDIVGYWIAMPESAEVEFTTDSDYFQKNPSWVVDVSKIDFADSLMWRILINRVHISGDEEKYCGPMTCLRKPAMVSVFGLSAPEIKFTTKLRMVDPSKSITVLGIPFTPGNSFKSDVVYEFERTFNFNQYLKIGKDENAVLKCVQFDSNGSSVSASTAIDVKVKYHCLKNEMELCDPVISDFKVYDCSDDYARDEDNNIRYDFGTYVPMNAKNHIDFQAFIQGDNFRVDLFRESDGVNITQVNKHAYDYYRDLPVETVSTDSFVLRASWLNATDKNSTYKISYKLKKMDATKSKVLSEEKFDVAEIASKVCDEGYKLFKLGSFEPDVDRIEICVSRNNEPEKVVDIYEFDKK